MTRAELEKYRDSLKETLTNKLSGGVADYTVDDKSVRYVELEKIKKELARVEKELAGGNVFNQSQRVSPL